MAVENDLLGIGRMSALSGLPPSALRFYDSAGVMRPAVVDPVSGYRFYRWPTSRLCCANPTVPRGS